MIYFDTNATTPILPEVSDLMRDVGERFWGNPSSTHCQGRDASRELEGWRTRLAALLQVAPSCVVFTSGGTESVNTAIRGVMAGAADSRCGISAIEHPAVEESARVSSQDNRVPFIIPVDGDGIVDSGFFEKMAGPSLHLVSVMYANNEIGAIQPVETIGAIAAVHGVVFHSDAVQAFGKIPLALKESGIALLSISSHKIYGPKGCGALICCKKVPFLPLLVGGHQELSRRGGTQNLPAIAGFVRAAEIAVAGIAQDGLRIAALTSRLRDLILGTIPDARCNTPQRAIPGTLNVSFPGALSSDIVLELDKKGLCVSGGSACHADQQEPSKVLRALGRRMVEAISGVRFSLGRFNTIDEVEKAAQLVREVVLKLRSENR